MKTKTFLAFLSLLSIIACNPVEENKNQGTHEEKIVTDHGISLYNYASSTISPEAKAIINAFTSAESKPELPHPDDTDGNGYERSK